MSEVYSRQKTQQDIQNSQEFVDVFSKIVSGKPNYRAVIEKKEVIHQCKSCNSVLDSAQKFCHECGTKVEHNN